jgi:NodT family efflux transporter outer membrane factor (OMF) lipoprotein
MTTSRLPRLVPLCGVSAIAIAALALGGCAALPKERAMSNIASPEQFAAAESLAAPVADWPSDQWWSEFGDAQLADLIEEGLAGATDLRIAEARFARANAFAGQARSALLPSLNAGVQITGAKQSYNNGMPPTALPQGLNDYGQASLGLSWDLDFWGRNRAALAAARSEAEAARAEAAAARLAVSTGIAGAYADLADLHAQLDAAQNAVTVRDQTAVLLHERKVQGLEHEGAVDRAVSALEAAKGQQAALHEAAALTRNRIAALLGAGPDRGLAIARPIAASQRRAGLPANLPANLIGRRPDVIAARLRTEAAASRIKQARAAFYPNVNLMGVIGLQALGIGNAFKSGGDFGSVGPAISLPIFEGGRLRSQYQGAEADYEMAVAQYDGVLTQALRDVADAATSQRALGERLSRAVASANAAQAAWTVANNRYRAGLATYLDVLAAEDALIVARREVASMNSRTFALDVALIRALGGGFQS